MAKKEIELIQELRERTGAGMLDCRKALQESGGDIEAAVEILRKKGASIAAKRAGRETSEGIVEAYIHPGNRVGVLLEMNCETDFVARTEEFKNLAKDLCMHIAAYKPLYLAPENVEVKFLEHEKSIFREQLSGSGKPEKIIDQIIEGKVNKLYSEICLLKQQFIKNDQITVEEAVKSIIAKTGENIQIRRFCRFEIGA
jgi:elongation factor Ts